MCMEDIRTAREMNTGCKQFTAPVNQLVAGANVNRIRLHVSISAQVPAQVYLFPRRLQVGGSSGVMTLTQEHPSATLRIEEWGTALLDDWFCTDAGGTQIVAITDVSLTKK